ncbi:MAG: hypothetical protein ACFFC0_00465 [Promethearchaeota archaeon]
MREARILLQSKDFLPEDRIEGTVVVSSDSAFDWEHVVISMHGEEHTRVIRGSRKHRRLYEEEKEHVCKTLELSGPGGIDSGNIEFPFAFSLPGECPSSYYGIHGWIRYNLRARVETPNSGSLEATEEVFVFSLGASQAPKSTSTSISEDGVNLLNVELPDNTINLGQDLMVRILVPERADFRGVRAEIVHREVVIPEGYETDTRTTFSRWYTKKEEFEREEWIEVKLKSSPNWPISFKSDLIRSQYLLKVTADIPRRFDKSVEIPVQAVLQSLPR